MQPSFTLSQFNPYISIAQCNFAYTLRISVLLNVGQVVWLRFTALTMKVCVGGWGLQLRSMLKGQKISFRKSREQQLLCVYYASNF